jgi:sensor c-di-GMP phosphodiesterase-like protein
MGFVISMDDFGTGYSSLEILLSSPVDIVKIDKSFLRKFDEGELNKEYIIKICELIRVTGKDIVFEGIENQNQIDFLLGNNCYYGQGFFFSKAIPVREFEEKFLFK